MTDPETTSLLEQAQARAGELAVRVEADQAQASGEVSVSHSGGGWIARAWAKVTARRDRKPEASGGVDLTRRW